MQWFAPKCPVEAEDKAWIEESMLWLIEEFGADTLLNAAVVLPTDEFFPDEFSGDEDDVPALVNRVCAYMNVDPERVELDIFTNHPANPAWAKYLEGNVSAYFKSGHKYLEKTGDTLLKRL